MDRLPEDKKLDISRTFESQRESVNSHIIPIIQKSINKKIFPVVDGIIKHIIHERHRHQRKKPLTAREGPIGTIPKNEENTLIHDVVT